MTSSDLCGYFLQSIKMQKQRGLGANILGENAPVALLFAKEEVVFDPLSSQIELPGLGTVELDTSSASDEIQQFDWVATVKDQADSWNIVLGRGNPYLANVDQGLPVVNGAVIAVPACLSPGFKNGS